MDGIDSYDMNVLKFICMLMIILTIVDINIRYKECIKKDMWKIVPTMLLHRIIMIFIYFGWLFNDKRILKFYLIFFGVIVIHWLTNNFRCFLTQYEQKVCDFPKDQYYDYFYQIFEKHTATIIANFLKFSIACIVVYKLNYL